MNRLADSLVRRRWLLVVFPIVTFMLLFLVATPEDGGVGFLGAVALYGAGAVVLTVLLLNLAGHDPDAGELAAHLVHTSPAQALLARWLRRSRYYRFVGGAVGFVLGVGFVGNGQVAPILVGFLAGVAAGGGLAEVHALRRHRSSARNADLTNRQIADYVKRVDLFALGGVAIGAVVTSTVALVLPSADRGAAVGWGLAALVTVAAAGVLLRLVAMRPRPALSTELREADDLLRHLAATDGFTRAAMGLSAGLLAQSVNALGTASGYGVATFVLWLLGLAWYMSSRLDRAHLRGRQTTSA